MTIRLLLRLDAALETVLALLCVALAYGLLGTDRWLLPSWLSVPLLFVVAVVLLLVAVALWWIARRPERATVRAVAVANAITALIFLAWAITGLGAGTALRTTLAVSAILLAALATAQYTRAPYPAPTSVTD